MSHVKERMRIHSKGILQLLCLTEKEKRWSANRYHIVDIITLRASYHLVNVTSYPLPIIL